MRVPPSDRTTALVLHTASPCAPSYEGAQALQSLQNLQSLQHAQATQSPPTQNPADTVAVPIAVPTNVLPAVPTSDARSDQEKHNAETVQEPVEPPKHAKAALFVSRTAFVDGAFSGSPPALENAASPYATINGALKAVAAARSDGAERWRIVVRPGTFDEGTIATLAHVDIVGSGPSTVVKAAIVNGVGAGPATLAQMRVIVPGTGNVTVNDTLSIHDTEWEFVPAVAAVGRTFDVGGPGSPALQVRDSRISVVAANASVIGVDLFAITQNRAGTTAAVDIAGVDATIRGVAAGVGHLGLFSGAIRVDVRDSTFDLTVGDAGRGHSMFVYGGEGIMAAGESGAPPPHVQWSVHRCEHTLRNAMPGTAPAASQAIVVLDAPMGSPSFAPQPDSRFTVCDCLFHFGGWPNAAAVHSAFDRLTAGNFVCMMDNKWTGLAAAVQTTGAFQAAAYKCARNGMEMAPTSDSCYMPTARAMSNAVLYTGTTGSGSMVCNGGLQTGVTMPDPMAATYGVSDGDTIVAWAPHDDATLVLPASSTFAGKWVTVHNRADGSQAAHTSRSPAETKRQVGRRDGGPTITVRCSGPADGATIDANGGALLFQTHDGVHWFAVSLGAPKSTRAVLSAVTTQAVAAGARITQRITIDGPGILAGGGFTLTPSPSAGVTWSVIENGPDATGTVWTVVIQNTGTVDMDDATSLAVNAVALYDD